MNEKGVCEQLEFELIVAGCVLKVYRLTQGFLAKVHDLSRWASVLLVMQVQIRCHAEEGLSARNFNPVPAVRGAANGITRPLRVRFGLQHTDLAGIFDQIRAWIRTFLSTWYTMATCSGAAFAIGLPHGRS
jgi:hypothetical protein